ncbi:proliferating cell nuclear antigen (pcna) [Candidatus Woesearchaeota archaeon]|jgi:proliferating cell nuclear antigen|nr:proliferating cell nuclear antigen (pcna) [Candidatus Woesearchaeota archaeon]MBT4387162.1 proliferating cell nuclear antigen (pcna) [Candidatus Woesearchaeota archaeon]MBT4596081.1 proliferating cell nuclear antigen (pcna) [Candidatus Woesearchaeota archaeon]MBT5741697.1 proliferating cell nuclear antigen (pcna) [Candidatus Woesearchaeota archaeon]MBT6506030.1 proliferating cell nuclear antigen (pcna) [Candidatus Woesearchaeota archaeon]
MKLTLAESKYLKEGISIISELVNEGKFRINENAMELIAMDPASVALVNFKLLSSAFSVFEINEPIEMAINLGNLRQILKRAKPTDIVSLTLEENTNKLIIEFKSKSKRTFTLPIIDLDEKEQKVPDLSFDASIKMSSETFTEIVEDAEIVAESLCFIVNNEKFVASATGDLSDSNSDFESGDLVEIAVDEGITLKSKFSIEYLKKIVKGSKLSGTVNLKLKADYPMQADFKVVDRLLLSFILAPRVDAN